MNSYWLETTKPEIDFPSLQENQKTDVCIIGAGIFGLTTAYYLSKKGLNVIVLDKEGIGEKTSGHTTAKITSQHDLFYSYLIQSFGTNYAKGYLEANEAAIKNIESIIQEEKIDCDFEHKNNYVYTTRKEEISKIQEEVDSVKSLGFDCDFVPQTELPFEILGSIRFKNQAQFHPRKYMLGLCNSILNNQGKIYVNSRVYDVKKDLSGYITITKDHQIHSKYVVLASHYPFVNIPGFYFTKMYQETSYIICVDTHTDLFDDMYINVNPPIYSFRTVPYKDRKLLLLGGGNHKTGQTLSSESTYGQLEKEAKKLYPNSEVLYRWNTEDCISLDKVPYIGKFSNFMPHMYVGTGFKKWGMTTSNVAANIVTDNILGIENKYEEIFSSTRMEPIKNHEEVKNIVKQTVSSLVVEKFKIPEESLNEIKTNEGKIIEIGNKKVGIYIDENGKIFAVNPICTHLGCLLSWNNTDKTWDCPCHGSRFDFKGHNLYDPAIKDLETIEIEH